MHDCIIFVIIVKLAKEMLKGDIYILYRPPPLKNLLLYIEKHNMTTVF